MDADELARLYDGFERSDRKVAAEFFELFMRAARREMTRWKALVHRCDEVESESIKTLCEWQATGLLRRDEPIEKLAARVVKQVARQEKRDLLREREGQAALAAEQSSADDRPDALAEVEGAEFLGVVAAIVSALPLQQQKVFEAHLRAERGGPSVGEATGLSRGNWSKLLSVARATVLERLLARKAEIPEEWRAALDPDMEEDGSAGRRAEAEGRSILEEEDDDG